MLELINLTKKWGNETVIDNFNLEFQNGINVLLAPNGAGKTTLMKMITTLAIPTGGEIRYLGKDIFKLDKKYRNLVGYLPQKVACYKNYSAEDFLHFLAVVKDVNPKEIKTRINELLELVELTEVKKKKVGTFSGGMLQRLMIAGVIINEPKIVVLDEPTTGLDPKERIRFKNIISSISRERIVIISTHITSEIEFIANRVIMLKDRKILYNALTEDVIRKVEGKIYETCVEYDQLKAFEAKYLVISERQQNDNVILRFFCDADLPEGSKCVAPRLEDVFIVSYR